MIMSQAHKGKQIHNIKKIRFLGNDRALNLQKIYRIGAYNVFINVSMVGVGETRT